MIIESKDFEGLKQLLANNPNLANEGITIPFDFKCRIKAHPLHRICDAVFGKHITDDEAVRFAQIFLENGARINGDIQNDEGTPLLAAASLHAEKAGIFYIDNGADISYTYKNDGASALHWASFCGRDKLVDRLIKAAASIDLPDTTYKTTPIGWALHALLTNDKQNMHNQVSCINSLLKAGADTNKLSKEANDYLKALAKNDSELQRLLK